MGTFHVKAQREVARKHPLPPRLLPGKGVSSRREAVDSPERRAYNSHTFRPGKPIGAPDSEIPNPHGGGLRQSTQNRRLGHLCSGKPSLKPIPMRVFLLVPTYPHSERDQEPEWAARKETHGTVHPRLSVSSLSARDWSSHRYKGGRQGL